MVLKALIFMSRTSSLWVDLQQRAQRHSDAIGASRPMHHSTSSDLPQLWHRGLGPTGHAPNVRDKPLEAF